jgi:hypothetical protein
LKNECYDEFGNKRVNLILGNKKEIPLDYFILRNGANVSFREGLIFIIIIIVIFFYFFFRLLIYLIRVLLKKTPVLILDDVVNYLFEEDVSESHNESNMRKRFQKYFKDYLISTTILVLSNKFFYFYFIYISILEFHHF